MMMAKWWDMSVKGPGLRSILVLPFVLQITLAVGLTGYLALHNGQRAVNDVAGQLRQEITARVQDALQNYLRIPQRINYLHAAALASGSLDLHDSDKREQHFLTYLDNFPEVSNTYFGTATGELFGAREALDEGDGKMQITLKDASTGADLHYYNLDADKRRGVLAQIVSNYEPRTRPWYESAAQAGRSLWSEIFRDAGSGSLALTAALPVYDHTQRLQGVFGTALRLSWLEEFLARLKIGQSGQVFIIERNGYLVASSRPLNFFRPGSERLHIMDSADPLVRATAVYLLEHFTDFSQIKHMEQLEFSLNGTRQFLQVTPLFSKDLDWVSVVVVPEADFMEQIQANTRMTVMLSALALLMALIAGILTTRWISRPLLRLNKAAQALAAGQWNGYVPGDLKRRDEVGELAQAFHSMAGQLRMSFNQLEEKVRVRTQDLAEKNEQLVQLNQDKNEFLGIAAHDLKNPLSAIKGLAEEIEEAHDDMTAEELTEYAGKIREASEKMFALITNLLDVNAIESGKMNIHPAVVDLAALGARIAAHYTRSAQSKNIALFFHALASPCLAYVDESTTQQILDNLISNAVKYSPPARRIDVRIDARVDKIRCEIQDQGPGLSAEDKQKLFGKFNRLSAKPTGGEHSTGLGLFIVKKMVEAMGGEVWCESEEGHGATFIVELPAATSQ
jgi:signal transduction histidine kinase